MSNIYIKKTEQMTESVKDSAIVQQVAWDMFVDTIRNLENNKL